MRIFGARQSFLSRNRARNSLVMILLQVSRRSSSVNLSVPVHFYQEIFCIRRECCVSEASEPLMCCHPALWHWYPGADVGKQSRMPLPLAFFVLLLLIPRSFFWPFFGLSPLLCRAFMRLIFTFICDI